MYCRNCGKEINTNAEICVNCGVRPLAEKNFCQDCGVETKPNQELCIKCGVRLKSPPATFNGIPLNTNFSLLPYYYQQEFQKIFESNEIYKGKWNWPAFLFTWIWAFSKGAWGIALVMLFIGIPLSMLTFGIFGLIMAITMGIKGNYFYYNVFVKGKQNPF